MSGAPRDKLGMREPPAPGVPRADAAMHPPRACPRAHGPRCACVPVAGGGRLACSARALPSAGQLVTAVPDAVTSCPATSCPAQGIACALHGPRIRAGRGRALTPHGHCICRRARRPCSSSPAALRLAVRWGSAGAARCVEVEGSGFPGPLSFKHFHIRTCAHYVQTSYNYSLRAKIAKKATIAVNKHKCCNAAVHYTFSQRKLFTI